MSREVYERNLHQRLEELRQGDPAYLQHTQAIWDAILNIRTMKGSTGPIRILDSGCGLGFLSKKLTMLEDSVVGIDPSGKAITLAQKEHQGVNFYQSSAESFPAIMEEHNLEKFDVVVLNMVLHSVDDGTCINILEGAKKCLNNTGAIILIVPSINWVVQKLIEYSEDKEINPENLEVWLAEQLKKPKNEVPMRIREGKYYPFPITVYPRNKERYGQLLNEVGYSYLWNGYDAKTEQLISSVKLSYLDMNDYTTSIILDSRNRSILVSFYFTNEYWEAWKELYNYQTLEKEAPK